MGSIARRRLFDETVTGSARIDLTNTGNFCFVVVCRDATLALPPAQISPPLQRPATTVGIKSGRFCEHLDHQRGGRKLHLHKERQQAATTGWVSASTSGLPGREGRAVVYRYPPPPNGRDTVAGANSVRFTWAEGMSTTHALVP
jgi:hypothetical protein